MTHDETPGWEDLPLPGMPDNAPQAPQTWRYTITLTAVSDPAREVDRALRVWFGDIVKDITPC
jgi:hypothetical protein